MKALRAWETPRRHRNSTVGCRWDYVAGHHWKNAEGTETAREAAVSFVYVRNGGTDAGTLKRCERLREVAYGM